MRFKKVFSIIMVFALCVALFSGCGEEKQNTPITTTQQAESSPKKTIAMVGFDENGGFGENVKKGAEDAAKKYGFKLNFISSRDSTQNKISTQIADMEKLLNDKASGVVIALKGEGYADALTKLYDAEIPVVQIDYLDEDDVEEVEGRNKNPIVATVATDYKNAGALCAEELFKEVKEYIKKSEKAYVIGVIERDDETTDEEKISGFTEKFTELADADESTSGKYKIETESETEIAGSLNELMTRKVNVLFLTSQDVADEISDIVFAEKDKYKDIVFCGFDSGAKQLKWLERDDGAKFIGGVTQDAYNIGYNAVEQCIFSVQGKEVKPEIKIEAHWYNKNNYNKMKQEGFLYEK